jgi:uncharacterized protein
LASSSTSGYIFISYAHKDTAIRQRILDSLRRLNNPVWIDTDNLQPGTPNWEGNIEKAIKGCGAVVVLLSPAASISEWVLREVQFADVHLKRIIPVLVDGNEQSSIPIHLISYQRVDLTKNWTFGIQQLVSVIISYSQGELEKMRVQAEMAVQQEAARLAAIKAYQEKAARETAERIAREKSESSREEKDREQAIRVAQEEARRKTAEKIAQEESKRQAEEEARRKAAEDFARKDWVTSDDKLWGTISYVFAPIVGIVAMLIEDKKNRPFVRFHAVQSIVAGITFWIMATIITTVTFGIGGLLVPIVWLLFLYWAYKTYQGEMVNIPVVTNFIKNQGWA